MQLAAWLGVAVGAGGGGGLVVAVPAPVGVLGCSVVGTGAEEDGTVLGPALGGDWESLQPAARSAVSTITATGRFISAPFPGGAVDGVAGMPGQRCADVVQVLDLFLGERVEDRLADLLDVAGRRVDQLLPAELGEDGHLAAPVGLDALAFDPAVLLEPVDRVRQATARTLRGDSQFAHPQPIVRRVGQSHQDLVVVVRDAGVALQLLLDAATHYSLSRDVRAPGLLLSSVEPPGFRHPRSVLVRRPGSAVLRRHKPACRSRRARRWSRGRAGRRRPSSSAGPDIAASLSASRPTASG